MIQMTLKAKLPSQKDLEYLKQAVRKEVIETGLDKALEVSVKELQATLLNIVNEGIREKVEVPDPQSLEELALNIPKSDFEIIKHITNVDVSKFVKTKDYSTLSDNNVVMLFDRTKDRYKVNEFSTHPMSSGLNLRIPMGAMDTFSTQYNKATNYFNNSLYIIEERGQLNYYMNPGINLTQQVKVVCSNQTGMAQRSVDKFEQHRTNRGYADWSLKANTVNIIKNNFINLSDVVGRIKEADFEGAQLVLDEYAHLSKKAYDLRDKIDELNKNKGLEQGTEAYFNVVNLVKNLKILKTVEAEKVLYHLISNRTLEEGYANFLDKLNFELSFWKIHNQKKWLAVLRKKAKEILDRIAKKK